MAAGTVDRFESFAERYIIERAHAFQPGREKEDAWQALNDAEKVYGMVQERTAVRNGANQARDAASSPMQAPPGQGGGGFAGLGGGGSVGVAAPPPVQSVKDMVEQIQELEKQGVTPPQGLVHQIMKALHNLGISNPSQLFTFGGANGKTTIKPAPKTTRKAP